MSSNLRLHWEIIKRKYAVRIGYRTDFIISLMAAFVFQIMGPFFIMVLYAAGGTIHGWTVGQIILLQGILTTIRGTSFMLFFGLLWNGSEQVRKGTFDLILLKPRNTLYYFIMDSFDEEDLGQTITGLIILSIGVHLTQPTGNIPITIILMLTGLLFFYAIAIMSMAITVLLIGNKRIYEIIEIIVYLAGYPKTAYGKISGTIFTAIFPILIAGSYPANALLNMPINGAITAIISTIVMVAIAQWSWKITIKKYTSAGG